VIQHPAFPVEPWAIRETALHLDALAQTESVFALANGHVGLRGNLDRASRTAFPAPTSAASTRSGRSPTRRRGTAFARWTLAVGVRYEA